MLNTETCNLHTVSYSLACILSSDKNSNDVQSIDSEKEFKVIQSSRFQGYQCQYAHKRQKKSNSNVMKILKK